MDENLAIKQLRCLKRSGLVFARMVGYGCCSSPCCWPHNTTQVTFKFKDSIIIYNFIYFPLSTCILFFRIINFIILSKVFVAMTQLTLRVWLSCNNCTGYSAIKFSLICWRFVVLLTTNFQTKIVKFYFKKGNYEFSIIGYIAIWRAPA